MRNPSTGQEATCYTPYYYFMPSLRDLRIAGQCIHACELQDFRETEGPATIPHPRAPDADVRPFIPEVCLGDK
jgi:hypothetical protein